MAHKNTIEDAGYMEGERLIYTVSALDHAEDPNANSGQAVCVAYEVPSTSGMMPEVEMFHGQYLIHSDESDMLTSILCGEIPITNTGSLLGESLGTFYEGNVAEKRISDLHHTQAAPLLSSDSVLKTSCTNEDHEKLTEDSTSSSLRFTASISDGQDNSDSKRKVQMFSMIRATLSPDFLATADGNLREIIQKTMDECHLQMVRSSQTDMSYMVGCKLKDFLHLEKIVSEWCELKEAALPKLFSKSVSTESKPETCDRSTMCCLLQPQFTRSGREIRYKDYHLYEETAEEIGQRQQRCNNKSTEIENHVDVKAKKKRGRPRKNLSNQEAVENENRLKDEESRQRYEKDKKHPELASSVSVKVVTQNKEMIKSDVGEQEDESVHMHVTNVGEEEEEKEKVSLEETDTTNAKDFVKESSDLETGTLVSKKTLLDSKNYENRAPFKHCPVCSFRTKRESHLQKHIQLHDRNIPILWCSHCSFCTTRQNHLTRHEMQHKSTIHHCDSTGCSYKTDNRRLLQRHKTLRHSEAGNNSEHKNTSQPLLECPVSNCTYRTHRVHLIRRHLVRHTPIDGDGSLVEQYSCSVCSYETKRREHYLRHIHAVHSDLRPYLCDNCGRSFKRKDSLVQHSIVHQEKSSRVYPFECQTCHTKFRSQGHLHDHQAKHTSDRSYLCEICGSSFKTKAVQRKHILSIHNKPRSFVCTICSKCFNTSYALRRHTSSHSLKANNVPSAELLMPVSQQNASVTNADHTVQMAVVTAWPSTEQLQGGIVSIQPRLVSLDENLGSLPIQVLVGAPQMFALDSDSGPGGQSSKHVLQQAFFNGLKNSS